MAPSPTDLLRSCMTTQRPENSPETLVAKLDRWLYPTLADHWDDERFRIRILERLRPGMHILDLGAGAGHVRQMDFRGQGVHVCGVDPDPRVQDNPHLDEAFRGTGESIPYEDSSFHLVFADNVLEHLEEPARVFSEVARVLRPGGVFLAKTPNRWHYMPLAARMTPTAFHRFWNRLRGRPYEDTFPTRYRANTPRRVRKLAREAGLRVEAIELIEGRPEYLRVSALTYVVGALYERVVNGWSRLARFRVLLIAELRKPAS